MLLKSIQRVGFVLALMSLSFTGANGVQAADSFSGVDANLYSSSVASSQRRESTYHESCTNISVSGNVLTAECRRENGRYRRTSIEIRGIHNDNGNLEYTRGSRDRSTFHESCRNIRIDGTRLTARCERMDGSLSRTSIQIRGIHNNNGRLEYADY